MTQVRSQIESYRRDLLNWIIEGGFRLFLMMALSITLVTTATVIVLLVRESLPFFQQIPLKDFLFGTQWEPLIEPKSFGVLPLVSGTMMIVAGAMLLAVPSGIMIATYLNEFASSKLRALIKPILEILAGIPTVVYGYFALTFVTPVLKEILPDIQVFNALSAAIVVGIMILPMVASLTDDAFRAVPNSLREGAYAVGATPFEVITDIVIPASRSRIGAAVILGVSRAIGETMAVTLAAGATPKWTFNPLESIQTMTAYIVQVSLGDTPAGGIEYQTCFVVALLLFAITMVMNFAGNMLTYFDRKVG